jgi:hypothetical protein
MIWKLEKIGPNNTYGPFGIAISKRAILKIAFLKSAI